MIEEAFEKLSHVERKLLARSAGKKLEEVPKAIIPTYRVMNSTASLEGAKDYIDENSFFAALCIRCLYEGKEGTKIKPEEVVKKARNSKELTSLLTFDKRIAALMDCSERSFFIDKYAKLFKYISKLLPTAIPEGDQLYKDIVYCNNPAKTVQRQWAKSIYSVDDYEDTEEDR